MKKIRFGISSPGICHHPFYIFNSDECLEIYITTDGIFLVLMIPIILFSMWFAEKSVELLS